MVRCSRAVAIAIRSQNVDAAEPCSRSHDSWTGIEQIAQHADSTLSPIYEHYKNLNQAIRSSSAATCHCRKTSSKLPGRSQACGGLGAALQRNLQLILAATICAVCSTPCSTATGMQLSRRAATAARERTGSFGAAGALVPERTDQLGELRVHVCCACAAARVSYGLVDAQCV